MKIVIRFLGLPLSILLILPYLLLALGFFVSTIHYNLGRLTGIVLGQSVQIVLVVTFGLSIVYILIGIVGLLRKKTTKESSEEAKRMVERGIIGISASLLLFLIIQFILSLYGLTMSPDPLPRLSE